MDIFAKRILMQNSLRQVQGFAPFLPLFAPICQALQQVEKSFPVIAPLLVHPWFIASLDKFPSVKSRCLLVGANAFIKLSNSSRVLALCNEPVKFLKVDSVREFGI